MHIAKTVDQKRNYTWCGRRVGHEVYWPAPPANNDDPVCAVCYAKYLEAENARLRGLQRYAGLNKLAAKPRPVDKSMDEGTIERIYWERFMYTELPEILVTMEIGTGPDEFFRMVREEWQDWRANEYDEARNSGPGIRGELS
jgi:hypothetical protein